jgi:hypothetical protein
MQLGTQYPQDLNGIFGQFSMIPAQAALSQFQQATANNSQNMQQAQEDLRHSQVFNPLHEQGQDLSNQTTLAQLPGVQAQSQLLQNKASIDNSTLPQQLEAAKAKIATETDDNKVKLIENHGQKLSYFGAVALANGGSIPLNLQAQMPDEVRQLLATRGAQATKAVGDAMLAGAAARQTQRERENMITSRDLGVAGIHAGSQERINTANIEAGKFRNHSDAYQEFKAETSKDLNAQAAVEDVKKERALQRAAGFTQGSPEWKQAMEEAQVRSQRADALRAQETANKAAAANTANQPKLNLPTLTNTPPVVSTVPSPSVNGTQGSGGAQVLPASQQGRKAPLSSTQYQQWKEQAKQMNPNMSDADIEAVAKQKGYQ